MYNETLNCEVYTVKDFPDILNTIAKNGGIKLCGGESMSKHKVGYLDISSALDIETTNFIQHSNKLALMNSWQFAIEDDTTSEIYPILERTWDNFGIFVDIINDIMSKCVGDTRYYFPIYVHNLSFEYFFIKHYLDIEEVFVTKSNTPLYIRTKYIEFRCSYFLSGCGLKSLPMFIDNLDKNYYKLDGEEYDYNKIRTPKTPLTDREIAYDINDVRLLTKYISQKRKEDGDISKIALTKTGYARRYIAEKTMGDKAMKKSHISTIKQLEFHSPAEFIAVTKAYMGGHTACNPLNNGITLTDVSCFDFTSSYPAVMVMSSDFPICYLKSVDKMCEQEYKAEMDINHAIVGKLCFKNIRPYTQDNGKIRNFDNFIPSSKCEEYICYERDKEGKIIYDDKTGKPKKYEYLNNGKVVKADYLEIYATEMDFKTYGYFYKWDELTIENAHIYKKGYLPFNTIMAVLGLYRDKTTLKGVKNRELEYNLKKELVNALYGMAVTSPAKDTLAYDGTKWRARNNKGWIDEIYTNKEDYINDKIKEYNKKLNRGKIAIPYIQGIYVSSIARFNLSLGICAAGTINDIDRFCYSDTDSIYVQHAKEIQFWINGYNENVKLKMERMCDYYGIENKEIWRPKDIKGIEHPLGYWDNDGHCKYFKSLGAKRYIKLDDKDHFKITIAGLSKEQGAKYLAESYDKNCVIEYKKDENGKQTTEIDSITLKNYKKVFKAFKIGLSIPAEETGKLTHSIFSGDYKGTLIDYRGEPYEYDIKGGVYLAPASFEMSIDDKYLNFIKSLDDGITEFTYYD